MKKKCKFLPGGEHSRSALFLSGKYAMLCLTEKRKLTAAVFQSAGSYLKAGRMLL